MSQMINMLSTVQSRRMNEQRVSLSGLPGLRLSGDNSNQDNAASGGAVANAGESFSYR